MRNSSVRQPDYEPQWHIFNAEGKVLGRMATEVANLLRGKNRPEFVNHLDCGDHVVIINAQAITLTGNKLEQKAYHHYSGFPGGLRTKTVKALISEKPQEIIRKAVKGMLPKNKMHDLWLQRLHVYPGSEHPHMANVASKESK